MQVLLAGLVPLGASPEEIVVGVMRGYIDASGSQADLSVPGISAAGFVAKPSDWEAFELAWNGVLEEFGIVQFSAEDAAHFTGPFASWKDDPERNDRRTRLTVALIDAAAAVPMFGASTAIRMEDWNALNLEFQAREAFATPYGLVTSSVAMRLKKSEFVRDAKPRFLRIFVEHGDAFQDDLFELLKRNPIPGLSMIPKKKKEIDEHGNTVYVRQFELADLFAYETRLFRERMNRSKRPVRGSALALERELSVEHGTWSLNGMCRACEEVKVPRRGGTAPYRTARGQ